MTQNRREYLSLIGLAVAGALAGCSDESDAESGSTDDEQGGADDATQDVDEAEDEEGGADDATQEVDDGEDEEDDAPSSEYVNKIDGQVVLEYGETARVSNGIEATVHGVSLYDQMGDNRPEERDVFAVVQVSTENTSEEQRNIPGAAGGGWEIFYGDQQVSQTFNTAALRAENYEGLEGGDVQGGVTREGVVLFEIDEGFTDTEIDTLWSDNFQFIEESGERINVRWTANS